MPSVFADCVIPHPRFMRALESIRWVHAQAGLGPDASCLALIGPSGAGKTTVLEAHAAKHPRVPGDEVTHIPVLRVAVPEKPTVKSLTAAILESLDDPFPARGTAPELTARARALVRAVGLRQLMLDEMQHFVDRGGVRVLHDLADWLKVFVDETRVSLVIAGLERAQQVVLSNQQLRRRFDAPVMLERYDWRRAEDREEFLDILASFEELIPDLQPPELSSESVGFRLYCACGGLVGYLSAILRRAEHLARECKPAVLTMEHLATAYEAVTWPQDRLKENPFDTRHSLVPEAKLIGRVQRLGGNVPAEV